MRSDRYKTSGKKRNGALDRPRTQVDEAAVAVPARGRVGRNEAVTLGKLQSTESGQLRQF